jgi:hypothetical protein
MHDEVLLTRGAPFCRAFFLPPLQTAQRLTEKSCNGSDMLDFTSTRSIQSTRAGKRKKLDP